MDQSEYDRLLACRCCESKPGVINGNRDRLTACRTLKPPLERKHDRLRACPHSQLVEQI